MDTKYESLRAPNAMPAPQNHSLKPNRVRIALLGCGIALATSLLLAGLVIQLIVVHDYTMESTALLSTAPLGKTLAITQAASTVISGTAPLLLGLEAYRIANAWLAASRFSGMDRPTPSQLGVIMGVLSRGNIPGLWTGISALLGLSQQSKGPPLHQPGILRLSVISLITLLSIAYGCHAFETWLGVSSTAIPFSRTSSWNGPELHMSRAINQTECNEWSDPSFTNNVNLCGLVMDGNGHSRYAGSSEGLRVLSNSSDLNAVAFTDDNVAILIPPSSQIPENIKFVANTIGVKPVCKSITADCLNPSNTGPDAFIHFDCPASVGINGSVLNQDAIAVGGSPTGASPLFGIIGSDGTPVGEPWLVASNPFKYMALVTSLAYSVVDSNYNGSEDSPIGNTGFVLHGNKGAWNLISCEVTILDVQYQYLNGTYTTLNSSRSTLETTQRAVALSDYHIPTSLPIGIDGVGLYGGNYVDSFSLELSRELVALSSMIWDSDASVRLFRVDETIGSRLLLAPLFLVISCLGIYSVIALVVTFLALRVTSNSLYSAIARARLLDPLTLIHSAYGPIDAEKTWQVDPKLMFSAEGEQDRLNVGPMILQDGNIGFGVTRDPVV